MASVAEKLEAARQELLDISLRNNLINFYPLKSKGVEIVGEDPKQVFSALVVKGRAMSFRPARPKPRGTVAQQPQPNEDGEQDAGELTADNSDCCLQTEYTEQKLEARLKNTFHAAKASLEEQGVNILFLALGMLDWYESPTSEIRRQAPLVLIPVELYRTSIQAGFRLRVSGEDVGGNLSLQAKLKAEFGVSLPEVAESEELDLTKYFGDVQAAVRHLPRSCVRQNCIVLGFFSFAKFLMYKDLDVDSWPEETPPSGHRLISGLLGEGLCDDGVFFREDMDLDDELDPGDLSVVVDADSSQTLAILDVKQNRDLVIQGPPGTGKSQTITNLIAETLAGGKTVLFVAEKMAALEVVKRRLDQIGLGVACLELHSHSANKRRLLDELRKTLRSDQPVGVVSGDHVARLREVRDRLNEYCRAVNTPVGSSSVTPFQAYGYLQKLRRGLDALNPPEVALELSDETGSADYQAGRGLLDELEALVRSIGIPRNHVFWGITRETLLPSEENQLQASLARATETLKDLLSCAESAAHVIAVPEVPDSAVVEMLIAACSRIVEAPALPSFAWDHPGWSVQMRDIHTAIRAEKWVAEAYSQYGSLLIPEAWNYPVLELRGVFQTYGKRWWRFFISRYRSGGRVLSGLCREENLVPKDAEGQMAIIDSILGVQRLRPVLEQFRTLLNSVFGTEVDELTTPWDEFARVARWMDDLHQDIRHGRVPQQVISALVSNVDRAQIRRHVTLLQDQVEAHKREVDQLVQLLRLDERARFSDQTLWLQPFAAQMHIISEWKRDLSSIHDIVKFNRYARKLKERGLNQFVQAAASWENAATALTDLFETAWFTAILDRALKERLSLQYFDAESHARILQRFRDLDACLLQNNQLLLRKKHWDELPRTGAEGQIGVLLREFEKKRRHLPIRQLFQNAGRAIQRIKPVLMMSPLSIAKYVPPASVSLISPSSTKPARFSRKMPWEPSCVRSRSSL